MRTAPIQPTMAVKFIHVLSATGMVLLALCAGAAAGDALKIESVSNDVTAHGNGVAVGDGLVLTCAHVVDSGSVFVVIDGKRKPAKVVKRDETADLALLAVAGKLKPATFISLPDVQLVGKLTEIKNQKAETTAIETVGQILEVLIHIGADARQGISGSPILAEGRLIGIVKSVGAKQHEGCVVCVPVNVIESFLGDLRRE